MKWKVYTGITLGIILILFTTLNVYFQQDDAEDEILHSSIEISGKLFTLPSPIHSFLYLTENKFNWDGLTEEDPIRDYKYQSQIALHLGLRASDGVVHLYTGELLKAKKDRSDVLHYSNKLGVAPELERSIKKLDLAFIKGADRDDLVDAILNIEIKLESALRKKGREDLSLLIELGSWLGGLEIVSKGILRDFKNEHCAVLRQSHITELSVEILKAVIQKSGDGEETNFLKGLLVYFQNIHIIVDKFDSMEVTPESVRELSGLAREARIYLENAK